VPKNKANLRERRAEPGGVVGENGSHDHGDQHCESKTIFSSTIEGPAGWQTAVFRKGFGPFANFRKPEFVLGGSTAERAKDQHDRSAAIARDLDPAKWADASQELAVQVIREWAAAEEARHDAFYEELLRLTTSGQR
jgi:hypothetical protein